MLVLHFLGLLTYLTLVESKLTHLFSLVLYPFFQIEFVSFVIFSGDLNYFISSHSSEPNDFLFANPNTDPLKYQHIVAFLI